MGENVPTPAESRAVAEDLVVEIVRAAGGEFANKTNLFKAFWLANREHAAIRLVPMTEWPVVRMPNGPGIDRFDELTESLQDSGRLTVVIEPVGSKERFVYRTDSSEKTSLTGEQIELVQGAVQRVQRLTASAVSDLSHDESLSWNERRNGDPLDPFLDSLDPQFVDATSRRLQHTAAESAGLFDQFD